MVICLTRQLRDYLDHAEAEGKKLHLYVRKNTELSKQLKELWDAKKIEIFMVIE